jgi:ABC-type polysaccharide/polyol phosphate transport system ATPase subunit
LDGIILNSFGERKSYLFCLKCPNKKVKKLREPGESSSDDEEILESIVPKIKVQGLSKNYGKYKAVDSVNFDASKGEIISLLGHNGAGKTTILNIIAGLVKPTNGNALI